jgi:hypothetical protein
MNGRMGAKLHLIENTMVAAGGTRSSSVAAATVCRAGHKISLCLNTNGRDEVEFDSNGAARVPYSRWVGTNLGQCDIFSA